MGMYFNVNIEFDKKIIHDKINETINSTKKGYICVIDGNVLATANKNFDYKEIINNSLINLCDGSSIALLASKIYKKKFITYTGPEFFSEYVGGSFKQYFLGNTQENLDQLKNKFINIGYNIKCFEFMSLPFNNVKDFDYKSIANEINAFSPDIIWISLGAPKQEFFISELFPLIDKGILIAIGAAFNLYLDEINNKRTPVIFRKMKLEWLFRVIKEPKRVGTRALNYFILLPKLILEEVKKIKFINETIS